MFLQVDMWKVSHGFPLCSKLSAGTNDPSGVEMTGSCCSVNGTGCSRKNGQIYMCLLGK